MTNKGITLVALIITIIVMLILVGVTVNIALNGGLFGTAEDAAKGTQIEQDREILQAGILGAINTETLEIPSAQELENNLPEGWNVDETGPYKVTSPRKNEFKVDKKGNIEHIGEKSSKWNGEVNTPDLTIGLTPITYNEETGEAKEVEDLNSNWYNYKENKWANAVTKDKNGEITGYFVWIPRYEYKIEGKEIKIKFIPTSQTKVDEEYTHIHPAFRDGKTNNYMNGEWDEEIGGFWVAKYPAGYQKNEITNNNGTLSTEITNENKELILSNQKYTRTNSYTETPIGTINTNTQMSYPVFKPLTYAYNNITIGDSYTLAKEVAKGNEFYGLKNVDSHMLKNSEWGAVAYLTQSEYGRNTAEPNINNYYTSQASPYRTAVTGVYANGTGAESTTSITNVEPYYTETGKKGSSTGNIYGVYDLNGCIWERTAGYITNGDSSLNAYGNTFAKTEKDTEGYKTKSTKWATAYPFNGDSDTNANNYNKYKELKTEEYGYGDAILETSTAAVGSNGWNGDYSNFATLRSPFFRRGGCFDNAGNAGAFTFHNTYGDPHYIYGFRVVLVSE